MQSVIAGGLVLLTVVADRLFGIEVTRREWVGVGLTAAGLAFLAATLDGDAASAHSHYDPATLAVFLAAVGGRRAAARARAAPARACWRCPPGLLWATSDTSIKALSSHLGALGFGVLVHPLALVILVASLVGLLISARSLQLGDAVPMIALTSAAANLTTIAAGPLVFGEPMPASRLGRGRPGAGLRAGDRRRSAHAAAAGGSGESSVNACRSGQRPSAGIGLDVTPFIATST